MALKVEKEKHEEVEETAKGAQAEQPAPTRLRVYRKKSTFKGATENDFWYSATRGDGASVMCKFNCTIPDDISKMGAFEIYDIEGNAKHKEVTIKGETYVNYTYYITRCKFAEIPTEALPL